MEKPAENEKIIIQKCSKCGSSSFRLYHYLTEQNHDRVYFECTECGHFNARVIVHALIDPDKNSEAFLFRQRNSGSSRETLDRWETYQKHVEEQFMHIKEIESQYGIDLATPSEVHELYEKINIIQDS